MSHFFRSIFQKGLFFVRLSGFTVCNTFFQSRGPIFGDYHRPINEITLQKRFSNYESSYECTQTLFFYLYGLARVSARRYSPRNDRFARPSSIRRAKRVPLPPWIRKILVASRSSHRKEPFRSPQNHSRLSPGDTKGGKLGEQVTKSPPPCRLLLASRLLRTRWFTCYQGHVVPLLECGGTVYLVRRRPSRLQWRGETPV